MFFFPFWKRKTFKATELPLSQKTHIISDLFGKVRDCLGFKHEFKPQILQHRSCPTVCFYTHAGIIGILYSLQLVRMLMS